MSEFLEIIIGAKDQFSATFKNVGMAAAAALAVVGTALTKTVVDFAKYETALTDMGKVTNESLESIHKKMMGIPAVLGSSTELVKGYYQVISAGVTEPNAAMEVLKTSAMAAKAAHVEQSEVIKGLTKLMAGYGGEIKSVTEASDLLFTIEKEGQTSFQELIPVIGGLAKISSELNVNHREMAASLALITQTAGSTSEASTQYRAIMVGLLKPTKEMSATMQSLGFESGQAAIQQIGLSETLKRLKDTTGGSAEALGKLFANQEAIIGISALSAKGFDTLNQKVVAMGDGVGSTQKAFNDYKNTLGALWETFKNTIGKMSILIGKEVAPVVIENLKQIIAFIEINRTEIVELAQVWAERLALIKDVTVTAVQLMIESWKGLQMIWQTLKIAFAEFSIAINEGINFIIEKMAWMLEKVNFRGIFDNDIAMLQGVKENTQLAINELVAMKETALGTLADLAADDSSKQKIDEMKEYIKAANAELSSMGGQSVEGGEGGEGEEGGPQGFGLASTANILKTQENLEKLKEMHNQYMLSDLERLDVWHAEWQAKFQGNQEALEELRLIYNERLREIETVNIDALKEMYDEYMLTDLEKLDAWHQQQQAKYRGNAEAIAQLAAIYTKKMEIMQDEARKKEDAADKKSKKDAAKRDREAEKLKLEFTDQLGSDLTNMASAFGEKGKIIAKAAALPKAIMSMWTGAAKALELPFPANIAAAATVVATGMGYISGIQGAAHGGLSNVPKESTYILDKGERVLSPNQNKDLVDFMASGGSNDDKVHIENLNIYTQENLEGIDWVEFSEDKLIPAFSQLAMAGIKVAEA